MANPGSALLLPGLAPGRPARGPALGVRLSSAECGVRVLGTLLGLARCREERGPQGEEGRWEQEGAERVWGPCAEVPGMRKRQAQGISVTNQRAVTRGSEVGRVW